MKMAKKLLAVALAGVLALTVLTGCSGGDSASAKKIIEAYFYFWGNDVEGYEHSEDVDRIAAAALDEIAKAVKNNDDITWENAIGYSEPFDESPAGTLFNENGFISPVGDTLKNIVVGSSESYSVSMGVVKADKKYRNDNTMLALEARNATINGSKNAVSSTKVLVGAATKVIDGERYVLLIEKSV